NPLGFVLRWRPLVGLGLISYGVYLWHWPIGLWVNADNSPFDGVALFVVRSVLTLAVALASYVLVEMPIRRGALSRLPGGWGRVAPAALVVVTVGVLAVPAFLYPSIGAAPRHVQLTAGASRVTEGYEAAPRCDVPKTGINPVASRTLRVQLEGNSIAGE